MALAIRPLVEFFPESNQPSQPKNRLDRNPAIADVSLAVLSSRSRALVELVVRKCRAFKIGEIFEQLITRHHNRHIGVNTTAMLRV